MYPNMLAVAASAPAWVPSDLSGLEFWVKGDAGITTDAFGVTTWADQSGNGRDATQSTDARKPDNSATKNGLTVVTFDGTDDFLRSIFGSSFSQANVLFCVCRLTATGGSNEFIIDGHVSTDRHGLYCHNAGDAWRITAGANLTISGSTQTTDWFVFVCTFNSTSSEIRQNGSSVSTGDAGANAVTGLVLGALNSGGLNGPCEIAEVGLYSSSLSAGDTASLESYLNSRWAVY